MVKVKFEQYKPDYRDELKEMIFSLYIEDRAGGDFHQAMTEDNIDSTVLHLAEDPRAGQIFVFRVAEEIVGYAIIVFYWSNEYGGDLIFLDEIYIRSSWRRQKIGTQFIKFLEEMENIKGIQLEVRPPNQAAHAFYTHLGFQVIPNRFYVKRLVSGVPKEVRRMACR